MADGSHRFEWDAENRLKTVLPATTQPTAGDLKSVYDYDYLGRRTRARLYEWDAMASEWAATPLVDTRFVYDGWNLLVEWDDLTLETGVTGSPEPTTVRQYTWGLDLSGLAGNNLGGTGVSPVSDSSGGAVPGMHSAGGIGGLLAVLDWTLVTPQMSGLGQAYLYDGNGNVGQLVSLDDGSVVTAYEYDAYGNITAETDGEYAPENPFRFSTKFHDDETGWVYYGYRFYGPQWGRWGSRDPLGEHDGANTLEFVQDAPTFGVDSLGTDRWGEDDWWKEWLKGHPGFDPDAQSCIHTTLNRGCVGVTCINLGEKGMPDMSNCYAKLDHAIKRRLEMAKNCECRGKKSWNGSPSTPRIFSIRFWSGGNEFKPGNGGQVDMSPWASGGFSARPGFVNFDYGFFDQRRGQWIHANHCAPGMVVYSSPLGHFCRPLQDFDKQVFCVACEQFGERGGLPCATNTTSRSAPR
ncbi:MAG: RHS repeat-associated core domain-containing protein [Phycisphaerae bacterium]